MIRRIVDIINIMRYSARIDDVTPEKVLKWADEIKKSYNAKIKELTPKTKDVFLVQHNHSRWVKVLIDKDGNEIEGFRPVKRRK